MLKRLLYADEQRPCNSSAIWGEDLSFVGGGGGGCQVVSSFPACMKWGTVVCFVLFCLFVIFFFVIVFFFCLSANGQYPYSPGGGGHFHIEGDGDVGTCRWTGYDFAVINIGTGYLVALLRSSILAQCILWPSCGRQYWHRVSKSA